MKGRTSNEGELSPHSQGYLRIKMDGKWVLQHRYIIEQALGRALNIEEVVHHKNHNKQDNDLSNLRVMSTKEHSASHARRSVVDLICPCCGSAFTRQGGKVNEAKKKNMTMFCSRRCSGRVSTRKRLWRPARV